MQIQTKIHLQRIGIMDKAIEMCHGLDYLILYLKNKMVHV